jgi:transcription termination factor Rho
MLLQATHSPVAKNHPEIYLIVLLIDERPKKSPTCSDRWTAAISSTFDEPAQRHVQVAEMAIERPSASSSKKGRVDLLRTRLARAYNTVIPASGKVPSGGLDSNALQKPKRFLAPPATSKKAARSPSSPPR